MSLGKPNKNYTIKIITRETGESDEYTLTSDENGRVSLWNIPTKYGARFLTWKYLHSVITDESGKAIVDSNDGKQKMDRFLKQYLIETIGTKEEPKNPEGAGIEMSHT